MDKFQERAIESTIRRHREKVRRLTDLIQDYSRSLLRDLDDPGRIATTSHSASEVASYAQEIVWRLAAIDAAGEVAKLFRADEDGKGTSVPHKPEEG